MMDGFVLAAEQPPEVEWTTADGIFIKQMFIRRAGTFIPQHSHRYAHLSLLAVGAVRLWKDGEPAGTYEAPKPIMIEAGVKHLFEALVDGTTIFCCHNALHPDVAAVLEEHQIVGEF